MPPLEHRCEVLVWITENRAPSGSGLTDFVEEATRLAKLLRVDGVAEQGVDFRDRHERVERDAEHIHPPVGGSRPIGCRASSSAPAEVVFARSVEALDRVGGLWDSIVVVCLEEPSRVPPGYRLGVFDEAPQVCTASALWCRSTLTRKEGKQATSDRLAVGRRLAWPERLRDTDQDQQARGNPPRQSLPLRRRRDDVAQLLEVWPWTPFFRRASRTASVTFSTPSCRLRAGGSSGALP